jgi:hypothetical protein
MRARPAVAFVLTAALALPAAGLAAETTTATPTSTDTPAAAPTPAPAPTPRAHRKLNLGAFSDPYARIDDAALAELLRFYQHIEVEGKAPQELQVAMQAWWDHFNFQYAIYGKGYNIQKPVVPGAINILPLIDWLRKHVKEDRSNKMLPAEDEQNN